MSLKSRQPSSSSALRESKYVIKLNGAITASSAGLLVAAYDGLFTQGDQGDTGSREATTADAISAIMNREMIVGITSASGFIKA